jgi:D-alanyl-D-alanine dipeptidase
VRSKWDRTKGRPEPIQALNRIEELDNGEPLAPLAEAAPSLIMLREQVIPFLRQTVAEMAEQAAQSLPDGYCLGVIDAWRPFQRQKRIYEFMTNCALEVWPDMDYAQLRRRVNKWVAPPDQKAPPGHCTGAAVDVFLCRPSGEILDVWSPFTRFSAAPTYSLGLNQEAQYHRDLLVGAMIGAGFSNCRDEWWHYSYGDAGYAVRMGHSSCVYGLVELPEALYSRQEELWLEHIKNHSNPFRDGLQKTSQE